AADGNYRTACRGEHPISLVRRLYALGETAQGRALCSDKNQRLAANTPSKEERMQYFVTGATGFIGKRLVRALLQRRGSTVYFLLRPESAGKLDELLAYWGVTKARAIAVFGDLTTRKLGVSSDDV